ncbi:MAG: hypothetical protein EHM12_07795 [Dehalococcoidia bacterium]|nr:MAG: hypothetical protein EHM12_07795 [Dehalococcoidia bacterium]
MSRISGWKSLAAVTATILIMNIGAVGMTTGRVEAATIHVPGDYATISGAIAAASAGDTIYVAAGTYNENLNVNKSLTLTGQDSTTVVVTAANPAASVFNVTADSVNISKFTVSGASGGGQAGIFLGAGISYCNISNNILSSNFDGIWLGSGSHHNTLTGNTLSGNYQGFEVYISNYNTFSGNNASTNNNYGFKIDSGDHNTYINNIANSNTKYGFYVVTGDGGGATNTTFTNNTANLNTQYGIRINGGSGYTFTGNTFNLNVIAGFRLKDAITNLGIQNNNITNNPIGIDIDVSVADVTSWTITYNNFSGNSTCAISNTAVAGTLNAVNNWWGSNSGPGPVGPGTGDKITDRITYSPWAVQSKQALSPGGTIVIATNQGALTDITITNLNTLPRLTLACTRPYGIISFKVINLAPGATVVLTFTFPKTPPPDLQFWKYIHNTWINCSSLLGNITPGNKTVTITIKDGGLGDNDGVANGYIADPGTFVIPDSVVTTPFGASTPAIPAQQAPIALPTVSVTSAKVISSTRVIAELQNFSGTSATTRMVLYVDGKDFDRHDVTLAPGDTTTVNFDISKLQPGIHTIAVNNVTAGEVNTSDVPVTLIVILTVCMVLAAAGTFLFFSRKKKRSWD